MLRHAPRYFRGLVLADTRPQADTPEGVEGRRKCSQLVEDKGPGGGRGRDDARSFWAKRRVRAGPTSSIACGRSCCRIPPTPIAGAVRALMTRPDSTPLLCTIHCPTLIVVGDEDTVTPPALAEEMHRAIAGSELAVIPGAGHLSSLEQPEAFNAALARFLDHRL